MTKDQIIARGREAAAVLDNGAFKSAMSSLKESVIVQWKECDIRDREKQVLLLQMSRLADDFCRILVGMVETGNYEKREIEIHPLRDEPVVKKFFRKSFK